MTKTKTKTTVEEVLEKFIDGAFPDGDAPVGLLGMLTGAAPVENNVYGNLQRLDREFSQEMLTIGDRLREISRAQEQEKAAFAPFRDRLNGDHSTSTGEGPRLLGEAIVREMAHARIVADGIAMTTALTERDKFRTARQVHLGPLVELLHIRAGNKPHNPGLAAKLGVTLDELMTPRERQKLEAERRAEDERAEHKRAEDAQKALLYEQQEREREAARQREQAEAEAVEELSPVQWFNMVFENCEPLPSVVRTMDRRADANERAAALSALWDRQGWVNRSLAQQRAARLLHDHIAGVPRR